MGQMMIEMSNLMVGETVQMLLDLCQHRIVRKHIAIQLRGGAV